MQIMILFLWPSKAHEYFITQNTFSPSLGDPQSLNCFYHTQEFKFNASSETQASSAFSSIYIIHVYVHK